MQLQFQTNTLPFLQQVKLEMLTQEQTQELRLPEDMPDVGRILGAWGQVVLRGKEWKRAEINVSCGIMAWAMYMPDEGGAPQMAEAWIPFQFRWDIPPTESDGKIQAWCQLKSVDARITSARKLMIRASVSVSCDAWTADGIQVSEPLEIPEDICVLKRAHSLMLPKESGEKVFSLDEELTLPASAPKIEKLLRFSLHPELIDRKVLSDKVAFRGAAVAHILYTSEDGSLYTWDFELPMAQYAELEQEFSQAAIARINCMVTSLEMEQMQTGALHLLAGLTSQYVVADMDEVTLLEDAYSPLRSVSVQQQVLPVLTLKDMCLQTYRAEQSTQVECASVADVAFYPGQPRCHHDSDAAEAELTAQFQTLYYDLEGELQGLSQRWRDNWSENEGPTQRIELTATSSGIPQATAGKDMNLSGDILLDIYKTEQLCLTMVTGLDIGERCQPDPERPSLILRRAGNATLWEIAKATGSTPEKICRSNQLQEELSPEQLLLIPVL